MRQTELRLSPDDRISVEAIRSKGTRSAREVNRAHILLALDRGIPEAQVMAVLGVGRMMIWRTRAAYLDGGLDLALCDVQRPGRPRQYDTEAEARVAALACSQAPAGSTRLDSAVVARSSAVRTWSATHQPRDRSTAAKKNCLKPWRKLMWCIAALTEEYRRRMYHLLELYALPLRRDEPVVCVDEKSLQLLDHSRPPMPMRSGSLRKEDYEYVRRGTCNLFVAVQPKAGTRTVVVTDHRGKADFVAFVRHLLATTYRMARCLHLVLDNLNTHFETSFVDVLGEHRAAKLLRRVQFHYTPKHASWLNMAEIEIGVLSRQCLSTRFDARDSLQRHVQAWQQRRNSQRCPIEWTFTRQVADVKLAHHYVS